MTKDNALIVKELEVWREWPRVAILNLRLSCRLHLQRGSLIKADATDVRPCCLEVSDEAFRFLAKPGYISDTARRKQRWPRRFNPAFGHPLHPIPYKRT